MEQPEWLKMLHFQQELHRFSREMLSQSQKRTLTSSELELLSLLYLQDGTWTPLALSRQSGMKKEAVSRCLRQLMEKGCIEKQPHPQDERSYILSLTEEGRLELQNNYEPLLRPLYELRRQMGTDFDTLFALIETANKTLDGINQDETL